MPFASMDAQGYVMIIGAVGLVAVQIIAAWRAEIKTDTVAKKLKESTTHTDEKLDSIHTLVNSNMAVQLKLNSVMARRIAKMTNDPADMAAADLSEKLHREHEIKQDKVDAKEG